MKLNRSVLILRDLLDQQQHDLRWARQSLTYGHSQPGSQSSGIGEVDEPKLGLLPHEENIEAVRPDKTQFNIFPAFIQPVRLRLLRLLTPTGAGMYFEPGPSS